MNYSVQVLLGIFTVDKGKIKVLLMHKKEEPYKGYWVLPNSSLMDTLDETVSNTISNIGLPSIFSKQSKTYADIELEADRRVIGISYLGLIDSTTYSIKSIKIEGVELEWFDINSIPKTAFEHEIVINDLYNDFKLRIVNSNILKILFPSDFTLPELQKIYEQVLNVKLDRRNFRKKLINLGYINDTGDINEGYTGRPAKLYRFKDEIEERKLF